MMPVVLGQHPFGQLLKKAAARDLDALGLAVVAAADEDVALGEAAAGKENSRHRVGGAVLDGKGGGFLSSGHDGFMREFVNLPADRVVAFDDIDKRIAAITEFISVGMHAYLRFSLISHEYKKFNRYMGRRKSCIYCEQYP